MTNHSFEWWRGCVIYQIYPRSFMDSNDDGIGDIQGIISKLDYLADLGVDAIWLSPIFTSPMLDMGYDVSCYTDIDSIFGTLADFDELITTAHQRGLKVIIDQVLSHSSDQHPFFIESRQSKTNDKADWYVWADAKKDGTPPNNWLSIFGGSAWQWDTRRKQYYLHNFLKQQPDFNFHHPDVQDWILQTCRFWLERGVDGFRLDTVNYYFHDACLRDNAADYRQKDTPDWNPYAMQYPLFSKNQPENLVFLQRLRALFDEYDAVTSVGEVGDQHHPIETMGAYTTNGRLHMAYSFKMLQPVYTPAHFAEQVSEFFRIAPKGWPCWAFSNHDVIRHVSRWLVEGASATALSKQASALLFTLQGSVCLYQGEELGQLEAELEWSELTDPQGIEFWPEDKGRDGCRTPMSWINAAKGGFTQGKAWLPIKPEQLERNVADQQANPESVLNFYKQMIALRKRTPELRHGSTWMLDVSDSILAFMRGDDLLCVFNLSAKPTHYAHDFPAVEPLLEQGANHSELFMDLSGYGFCIARVLFNQPD